MPASSALPGPPLELERDRAVHSYQQLDRTGHGGLKAVSYRACLVALKRRAGAGYEFYEHSLTRTGSPLHARLNTQRKILRTLWVLWREGREFDPQRFLGHEPQPTATTSCG